jgi:hypothetical protein
MTPSQKPEETSDDDLVHSLAEAAVYVGDEIHFDVDKERYLKTLTFLHEAQIEAKARLASLRKVADASVRVQKAILDIAGKADAVDAGADIGFYVGSLCGELREAQEELAKATISLMEKKS